MDRSLHAELDGLPTHLRDEFHARIVKLAGTDDEKKLPGKLVSAFQSMSHIARTTIAIVARPGRTSRTELATGLLLRHGGAKEDDVELAHLARAALSSWPLIASGYPGAGQSIVMLDAVRAALADVAEEALAIPIADDPSPPKDAGLARDLIRLALTPGLVAQAAARLTQAGALHTSAANKLAKVLPDVDRWVSAWLGAGGIARAGNGGSIVDATRCRRVLREPANHMFELLGVSEYDWGARGLIRLAVAAGTRKRIDLGAALFAHSRTTTPPDGARRLLAIDAKRNYLALAPDVAAFFAGEPLATEGKSWVKADFEVVLGTGVSLDDAFTIGCAAELQHVDQVARLRLTRASVRAACALGVTTGEIREALVRVAGRELPAPVANALNEWAEAGAARLHEAILLEAKRPASIVERAANVLASARRSRSRRCPSRRRRRARSPRRTIPSRCCRRRSIAARYVGRIAAIGSWSYAGSSTVRSSARRSPAIPRQ